METTHCDLCGSPEYKILYQIPDLLLGRYEQTYLFVKCLECGLVYQNPRPTPEEMTQHYPPEYDSYQADPKTVSPWLRSAYRYGLEKRFRFIQSYKKSGELLDVGCGTGEFLNHVKTYHPYWSCKGVEINPYAANVARSRYDLEVFCGTLEQAAFSDQLFDAVTLWDVLEHVYSPSSTIKEIWRILKPGGILVFRVPNFGGWDSKLFKQYWAGLDAPRHLYVFSRTTISAYLQRAGFKILRQTSRIGNYPTFLLSLRFWLNRSGAKRTSYASGLMRILHSPLMRLVAAPWFFLGSLHLNGALLVVIAQK